MVDYVFVVDDAREWHARNLERNPEHYPALMRLCGPRVIGYIRINGPVVFITNTCSMGRRKSNTGGVPT